MDQTGSDEPTDCRGEDAACRSDQKQQQGGDQRLFTAVAVAEGADNELSQGSRTKIGGVQVIFSPAGQSADKVIEKLAYDAGKRGVETMVVTSDAAIQDTVFGGGVDRMSADGFSHEMGEYYEDARLDDTPKVARKNTVAERIPADTLARLKALRDGR